MAKIKNPDFKKSRIQLLKELKKTKIDNKYISGSILSNKLNISRMAVWKHIEYLRNNGYEISSSTNKGYKLIKTPDLLLSYELKTGLNTKFIGGEISHFQKISSTNEEARKFAEQGVKEGYVVIAEIQTKGKGRRGRSWISPNGGIWMTLILRPKIEPSQAPILTLLAGIVVARIINRLIGQPATLKWPNDVRIRGKKVCGILTELSAEQDMINYVLIGLGINFNISKDQLPKELHIQATSIQEEIGKKFDRILFTKQLLEEFEILYLDFIKDPNEKIPEILMHWRKLTDTLGQQVKIETITGQITGLASEITGNGSLLVISDNGEKHKIIAGDCIYLNQ